MGVEVAGQAGGKKASPMTWTAVGRGCGLCPGPSDLPHLPFSFHHYLLLCWTSGCCHMTVILCMLELCPDIVYYCHEGSSSVVEMWTAAARGVVAGVKRHLNVPGLSQERGPWWCKEVGSDSHTDGKAATRKDTSACHRGRHSVIGPRIYCHAPASGTSTLLRFITHIAHRT